MQFDFLPAELHLISKYIFSLHLTIVHSSSSERTDYTAQELTDQLRDGQIFNQLLDRIHGFHHTTNCSDYDDEDYDAKEQKQHKKCLMNHFFDRITILHPGLLRGKERKLCSIGDKSALLSTLWSLIHLNLLTDISISQTPQLVWLINDTADNNSNPELLLVRWCNYHLQRSGSFRRLTHASRQSQLGQQLKDGAIYCILMGELASSDRCNPKLLTDALELLLPTPPSSDHSVDGTMETIRMQLILRHAVEFMRIGFPVDSLSAEQLAMGNPRLHFWLLHSLYRFNPTKGLPPLGLVPAAAADNNNMNHMNYNMNKNNNNNNNTILSEYQRLLEELESQHDCAVQAAVQAARYEAKQFYRQQQIMAVELQERQLVCDNRRLKRRLRSRERDLTRASQLFDSYQQCRRDLYNNNNNNNNNNTSINNNNNNNSTSINNNNNNNNNNYNSGTSINNATYYTLNALDNNGKRVTFNLPVPRLNVSLAPLEKLLLALEEESAIDDSQSTASEQDNYFPATIERSCILPSRLRSLSSPPDINFDDTTASEIRAWQIARDLVKENIDSLRQIRLLTAKIKELNWLNETMGVKIREFSERLINGR